jgi:Tfp pilus assembly protein PilN
MDQNKLYEARLNQLQLRISTIQTLQTSRVGPVEMMHVLGLMANRSNDLYLLSVSNKGGRLVLDGQANSTDAIANFIASLQKSGTFDDVQLRKSYEDDKLKHINFRFSLDCVYKQSASSATTVPPGQSPNTPAAARQQAGM